ncbi:hypothetical protein GGF46_002280 [Coemansia sp. RSA 552]|nr:hypothetical protein GGF46_002280 [Coemansia sp. RSA 552]
MDHPQQQAPQPPVPVNSQELVAAALDHQLPPRQQQQQQSLVPGQRSQAVPPVELAPLLPGTFPNYDLHVPPFASGPGLNDARLDLAEWCQVQAQAPPSATTPPVTREVAGAVRPRRRRATTSTAHRRRVAEAGGEMGPPAFFTKTTQIRALRNTAGTARYTVQLFPKVDRGFFIAGDEWTCYRRNYFQVSCAFALTGPSTISGAMWVDDDDGTARQVGLFVVGITAHVVHGDRSVELVQHTPKRDKGPQMTPQPQAVRPGGLAAALAMVDGSTEACFERLQFKTATANNGRRRAAQQYYELEVSLMADCTDGRRVLVATNRSAPIVVRGRSPGHYADAPIHRHSSSIDMRTQKRVDLGLSGSNSSNDQALSLPSLPGQQQQAPQQQLPSGSSVQQDLDLSADDVIQALSQMVPQTAVPPPQEILARAQTMAMDPFGLQSLVATALPALQKQAPDTETAGLTLEMAASLALETASPVGHIDTSSALSLLQSSQLMDTPPESIDKQGHITDQL